MSDDARDIWRPGEVILSLYEVRDVITTGGMGLVYRVLHRGRNVELAVKVLRPDLVRTERSLRGFEVEAATGASRMSGNWTGSTPSRPSRSGE